MNKLHTLILMCLLSLVGISANAQGFHPCDANHDGTVDVADIAITANYILTGEYQSDEQSDDPYNGHEYVDLGLSVKWATCNVGADTPEDYGDYFAWGETEPKDSYDSGTYKWRNGNTYTKYSTSSQYGTVDNKTVLDPEDDVAHVNWGGGWRMPTKAELEELRNNCTCKWTTHNGVTGCKVTSNINGNSIFLPAAGYRYNSSLYKVGSLGYYWSSSLYSSGSYNAYCLNFRSDNVDWSYDQRYAGLSVRAVCQDQVPSITLSADSTIIMVGKTFQLTATVTPPHAIQTVTWTSSDPSVATVSESGLVKGVGTGTAVITATTAEGGLTATCNVEVVDPYNGHEYVDLGLPSGLLWATCNVGADAPEDYGDYFAWGETEPEPKDYYDWSTYKWCNGSYDTQTKYGTDSYFGTVDNKTVLDPEDDAAHVNWGGDWRMPTKAELEELLNNCTWKWTTQNGANGCKVTSNINGNSIFLPAAGYGYYGDVLGLGDDGRYWSSTHDGSSHAYDLRFNLVSHSVFDISRFSGYSVRAVLSE